MPIPLNPLTADSFAGHVDTTFRSSGNADTFALELTQVERQGAPSEAGARQPASLLCKAAAGTTGSPKHRRGELFSGS